MGVLHSENKGDFQYALSGNYWPRETRSRLTLSGASYETGLGSINLFLVDPELEARAKNRKASHH